MNQRSNSKELTFFKSLSFLARAIKLLRDASCIFHWAAENNPASSEARGNNPSPKDANPDSFAVNNPVKKILFLTHYFPPEVNAPASRTYEHAKRWVQAGHEVTVITGFPSHPHGRVYEGYRRKLWQWEEMDGIKVLRVWTFISANKGFFRRILNYFSFMKSAGFFGMFVKRPDAVIATSPQFFCAIAGWWLSLIRWRPFVFELRDLWPESIVAVGAMKRGLIIRSFECIENFLYKRARLIISVTESFKKTLMERGIPEEKIKVVTNGADLDFFNPEKVSPTANSSQPADSQKDDNGSLGSSDPGSKEAVRGQPSVPVLSNVEGVSDPRIKNSGDFFLCGYIGTIGMAHKVETMVEAADLLRDEPDIRLFILGDGAERTYIESLIKEKALDTVDLFPMVPKKEMLAYLAACDAVAVLLRKNDLFRTVIPSKIFEAMAMKKPIIMGVEGEAREIAEQADCCIPIEPENPDELANAVKRLKNDPDECTRLGTNGRKAVEERYNRDTLADRMLEYIEGIVKN